MSKPDRIEALVPHAGNMCLLERIVDWDAQRVVLATATHRSPENPLRSAGGLRCVHLCEYGAQAMAVHGGLLAAADGGRAPPGMLVSLRDVVLAAIFVDDLPGELRVEAERLHGAPGSWQYRFSVTHGNRELARGRAAVMLDRASAG